MASDQGAGAGTCVEPMDLYRLFWVSGGTTGEIVDHAPDADTLEATVRAHPARFGIPCESMILSRARRVPTCERRELAA